MIFVLIITKYEVYNHCKSLLQIDRRKKQTVEEVAVASSLVANSKTVGPDELPVELLKLGLHHDPIALREFHQVITRV